MKKRVSVMILITVLLAITSFSQQVKKHDKKSKPLDPQKLELYNQIFTADSIVFNALNNCDSVTYRKYLTDDLEFFHDEGGLHLIDEEMRSITEMCDRHTHIRRALIKKSLEVHKLGNYGAVEIGTHRFYHINKGESEHLSGEYRFVHVWQLKDGAWKISRIISYGHEHMNNN